MKHTLKITSILLIMFILTQLIGIYVVNFYIGGENNIPYGFDDKNIAAEKSSGFYAQLIISFFVSLLIAVILVLFLMRIKSIWLIRTWFFAVIVIALGITFNIFTSKLNLIYPSYFALLIGIILAYFKVFKKNIIIHNLTELLIYPGIAAIFVAIFNLWVAIIVLILISIYDIWAVWHSGIMQKMAKFQINEVKVFSGFFVPHITKKFLEQMRNSKKLSKSKQLKKKIRVNIGILGGGDVFFPLVTAGVMLKTFGILSSIFVIFGAALGLGFLLFYSKKKKYYPAMPFITGGIFIFLAIFWFLRLLI